MQSDRLRRNRYLSDIEHREYLSGISFTLAIGHMSAYMYGITDLTLGVSG